MAILADKYFIRAKKKLQQQKSFVTNVLNVTKSVNYWKKKRQVFLFL